MFGVWAYGWAGPPREAILEWALTSPSTLLSHLFKKKGKERKD